MAFKILFVLFFATTLVAADEECSCGNNIEAQVEELRNFLNGIPSDENQVKYPVLPGELSPLVTCENCIERNRKKRANIMHVAKSVRIANRFNNVDHRNKCPSGYKRIYFMCVPAGKR